MTYLKINALQKSYGKTRILENFSLELVKGEFLSLLGPSGSGKTTILRCVAGLETPDPQSGDISLDGIKLSGEGTFTPAEKRCLGMVFQSYAVWPHMNVFENVAFPLRTNAKRLSIDAAEIKKRTLDALNLVRLSGYERRYAHELSGGQQQRVALARALAMEPKLLLLDEPLSNLDALLREELGSEIRKLQQSLNLTTIMVTHDQKEALSLSDRIVVLDHGKIEAQGSPELLYSSPPSRFVAEFLSGAQSLKLASGEERLFLPRRWRETDKPSMAGVSGFPPFRIVSRIYLGKEYEYWAENRFFSGNVRFFLREKHDIGSSLQLEYDS